MKLLESSLSHPFARLSRVLIWFSTLFFVVSIFSACQKEDKSASSAEPQVVEVVEVIQKDVPIYHEWVGTLDGLVNATILAQVQGYLIKQNYNEGDFVKKGTLLFEIDPRPFQAVLDEAGAALAKQQAMLRTAQSNLKRILPLAEANAVSQRDKDNAVGAVDSAQAQVMAAQAQVRKAKLDLSFTKITSPIDGIAGIAKAQIGNLVGPGSTEELTTVSTVDPIKAYLSVSEQEYLKAAEKQSAHREKIPLEMILADGSVYPHKGEFAFADRQVDVRTGTIRVAAIFPNPNNILRPGQFARIRAEMGIKKGALVIPQRAVNELQGRYLVAMLGPENKVAIKPVKVSERFGQLWVVEEGLQAGEKVVAEGIQKVKEGMTVSPKPFSAEAAAASATKQTPDLKPEVKPQPETESR